MRLCSLPVVLASAALALPALAQTTAPPAQAQNSGPPARIGNVWDGQAHEPNPGVVRSDERAAGVALPRSEANQQVRELDRMGQKLIDKANLDAATAPPQPRPPNPDGR